MGRAGYAKKGLCVRKLEASSSQWPAYLITDKYRCARIKTVTQFKNWSGWWGGEWGRVLLKISAFPNVRWCEKLIPLSLNNVCCYDWRSESSMHMEYFLFVVMSSLSVSNYRECLTIGCPNYQRSTVVSSLFSTLSKLNFILLRSLTVHNIFVTKMITSWTIKD